MGFHKNDMLKSNHQYRTSETEESQKICNFADRSVLSSYFPKQSSTINIEDKKIISEESTQPFSSCTGIVEGQTDKSLIINNLLNKSIDSKDTPSD
jgi:hypothetical protein